MNGAGNDFIVLDNRFYAFGADELPHLARTLCRRHAGIGADGLLALAPSENDAYHFRMLYYNADGSRGTMCGNGARCLARYARQAGFDHDTLIFETDAGVYRADVPPEIEAPVTLHVPSPRGYRAVEVNGEAALFIWTGTEHVVLFRESVAAVPVLEQGPALRYAEALAPRGANVNFVEVQQDGVLRVRTYEKGVEAETQACGTGALAAAICAVYAGYMARFPVRIEMPGGALTVGATRTGETEVTELTLAGPATTTFRGTVEW